VAQEEISLLRGQIARLVTVEVNEVVLVEPNGVGRRDEALAARARRLKRIQRKKPKAKHR